MIILAIYYTIADVVLLGQCFYYRGFTLRDDNHDGAIAAAPAAKPHSSSNGRRHPNDDAPSERTSLLPPPVSSPSPSSPDWTHLSPAIPAVVLPPRPPPTATPPKQRPSSTRLQAAAFNSVAVLMVCAAGMAGWYLSRPTTASEGNSDNSEKQPLGLNAWGQVFGWLCAALYLGSRLPQLLLNWRRQSTEGVSMLFFLFACLGNLTYVLSILAFDPSRGCGGERGCEPGEAARLYRRYILVNLSWLAGSAGTLLLDFAIFAQFFMYTKVEEDGDDDEHGRSGSTSSSGSGSGSGDVSGDGDEDDDTIDGETWDQRPVLDRNVSYFA